MQSLNSFQELYKYLNQHKEYQHFQWFRIILSFFSMLSVKQVFEKNILPEEINLLFLEIQQKLNEIIPQINKQYGQGIQYSQQLAFIYQNINKICTILQPNLDFQLKLLNEQKEIARLGLINKFFNDLPKPWTLPQKIEPKFELQLIFFKYLNTGFPVSWKKFIEKYKLFVKDFQYDEIDEYTLKAFIDKQEKNTVPSYSTEDFLQSFSLPFLFEDLPVPPPSQPVHNNQLQMEYSIIFPGNYINHNIIGEVLDSTKIQNENFTVGREDPNDSNSFTIPIDYPQQNYFSQKQFQICYNQKKQEFGVICSGLKIFQIQNVFRTNNTSLQLQIERKKLAFILKQGMIFKIKDTLEFTVIEIFINQEYYSPEQQQQINASEQYRDLDMENKQEDCNLLSEKARQTLNEDQILSTQNEDSIQQKIKFQKDETFIKLMITDYQNKSKEEKIFFAITQKNLITIGNELDCNIPTKFPGTPQTHCIIFFNPTLMKWTIEANQKEADTVINICFNKLLVYFIEKCSVIAREQTLQFASTLSGRYHLFQRCKIYCKFDRTKCQTIL